MQGFSEMRNLFKLVGILSLAVFSHTVLAASNCIVTAPNPNVNLSFATSTVTTYVYFNNCTNRVRPSFQWINTTGDNGAFYLNNQSSTSILIPFYSRMGANFDNTSPVVGSSLTASLASADFNSHFSSSDQPKNLTMYTTFSLANFGDLSKYPAGTYKTAMIFSANEF